ncbi:MAG: LuxR C-terminal-related transcriptional regulator [Thiohalobacteraceae bacterium]
MWSSLPSHLCRSDAKFIPPDEWLEKSYARCITAQVPRDLTRIASSHIFSPSVQYSAVAAYARLLFSETLQYLSDQRGLLMLTDPEAMIVELHARPEILQILAERHGVCVGVRLVEDVCGTNAVLLGLRHRAGVVLRGSQHFCRIFQDWYSVAMPLVSGDGRSMGCVSMAMPDGESVANAAALVKFVADDLSRFCQANRNVFSSNDSPARLTQRQQQVLEYFAQGMSYKEIARTLGIRSVKTIEEHLDAVRAKLNASCRRECIRRAAELGLLRI